MRGIDAAGFGRKGLVEMDGAEFVGQRVGQFFVGAHRLAPSGADKKEKKRREKTAQIKMKFANESHSAKNGEVEIAFKVFFVAEILRRVFFGRDVDDLADLQLLRI